MASTLSVICALVFFCIFTEVAQSRSMQQQTAQGTPFKALCSRSCEEVQEKPADGDFPLYQCSCSCSCSIFGDCCFDSPHNVRRRPYKTDFICISVAGYGRYRAISSCPPDQVSDFCKDGLGNQPPVTSRKTSATYANRFCAKCNGEVEELVTWNVELRCPSGGEDVTDDSPDGTVQYVYRYGNFWSSRVPGSSRRRCEYQVHFNDSSFMKGLELRPCDTSRKISHCSSTWTDLSVLNKCRSYEDPVYFHDTAYRNSHCAQCNYLNLRWTDCFPSSVKTILQMGFIDSDVKNFCKTRGSDACIQSILNFEKGRSYAFADLLKISETGCVPPKGRKCCKGEAFDRRIQRCSKVFKD